MKKIVLVIILASAALTAQTVIGKYAGEFMAIGVGGRALGMGGAFSAVANDVSAAYYNPAGLVAIQYPQVGLMHDERYGGLVNYNYGGVALPFGAEYTFAVTATRVGIDGISDTRNALIDKNTGKVIYDINNPLAHIDRSLVKEISNQDWAVYLSAAKNYDDKISYGINVKLISRSIGEYSAFGVGFDIGGLYRYTDNLTFGLCAQDITTTLVAWSTGRNELITPTIKAGTAYSTKVLNDKLEIIPALDLDIRFENRNYATQVHVGPVSIDPHAGVELNYNKLFAIRAGYNDVKQITIGAGIRLPKLNIDYTFARFAASEDDRLDDSHRISLMLTLEEPRFMRK